MTDSKSKLISAPVYILQFLFAAKAELKLVAYAPKLKVNLENDQKGFPIDQVMEKPVLALT